ncbi:hypothetical protein [Burkholderia stabilis]|nr:hypothetical protein [Burkholderia stabilis]
MTREGSVRATGRYASGNAAMTGPARSFASNDHVGLRIDLTNAAS